MFNILMVLPKIVTFEVQRTIKVICRTVNVLGGVTINSSKITSGELAYKCAIKALGFRV